MARARFKASWYVVRNSPSRTTITNYIGAGSLVVDAPPYCLRSAGDGFWPVPLQSGQGS